MMIIFILLTNLFGELNFEYSELWVFVILEIKQIRGIFTSGQVAVTGRGWTGRTPLTVIYNFYILKVILQATAPISLPTYPK